MSRWPPRVAATLALVALCDFPSGATEASIDLPLEPIYQLKTAEGKQRFATRHDFDLSRTKPAVERTAFRAVCTNEWLPGLVPIFAIEKTNRFELRRRPPRGQENGFEPLFFGVPLGDEPDAPKITGRWECQAVRNDSLADLAIELTIETNAVAARFDQYSEYRYAFIMGGNFASNHLFLRVEYIDDVYFLNGVLAEGKLTGQWRQHESSQHGAWRASRREPVLPSTNGLVHLHEWRRGQERRYTVERETMHDGWERNPRPLCRVWPAR